MRSEIQRVIDFQEEIGLDVLVHGEPERNDMVQYFAEQMEGYVFTQNAWVQSYGSRYVRPPIVYGDISRPSPMTTDWIAFSQSRRYLEADCFYERRIGSALFAQLQRDRSPAPVGFGKASSS